MFDALIEFFQGTAFELWGPFLILLACGLGVPVPEDIVLIVAGVLASEGGRDWVPVAAVMYVGVLSGDSMIFLAGRFFGTRLLALAWVRSLFSAAKQEKVESFFERHGAKGLFLGRFLPGLRAPIYFSAGSMKVGYLKFLLLDGFAALISVPVFVWLGHWLWARFHADIAAFHRALDRTQGYALVVTIVLVVLAGIGAIWLWRRHRARVG